MPELQELLKNIFSKKSTNLSLLGNLIVAILNYIAQKNSWIKDFLCIRVYFLVASVVLFLIIRKVLDEIINSKQKGLVQSNLFNPNQIKLAKIGRRLNILLFVFVVPLSLLVTSFIAAANIKEVEGRICEANLKKTGLLIANFSEIRGDDDGFTSTLFGRLRSDLQHSDTLNIKQLKKYITESSDNYVDTIKKTFQENCSKSGLIVFGSRKDNLFFNCRIYSLNYLNFHAQTYIKTNDTTIIYIENPSILKDPNFLSFTIGYQVGVISDFIHGLLYNHSGNYKMSSQLINNALKNNNNPANRQFISICHLFIGNNLFKEGNTLETINEYKAGITADSTNAYLHYNIAAAYKQSGSIAKAFEEYNIGNNLNPNFSNPLHAIKLSPKISGFKKILDGSIKDTVSIKDSLNGNNKSKAIVKEDWEEHCTTICINQKYGVVNNRGDTIVFCKYDSIDIYHYRVGDCFIIKQNNKFGGVIHVHNKEGYTVQFIPIEYSSYQIKNVVENCVDTHYTPDGN